MKRLRATVTLALSVLAIAVLWISPVLAQNSPGLTLRGAVTDPSGAAVPEAVVVVRGAASAKLKTDSNGAFTLGGLRAGKYTVRILAKGFAPFEQNLDLTASTDFAAQIQIASEAQVITVQEEINEVTTDPTSNGGAIVLHDKELQALSDDPDELSEQLQAMAGPSNGPNGGQIYIDGFTGGNLPPKSSIREVRINSNPFSSEYDRPGFGRIEILTKPGTDYIRGQAFFQYSDGLLNSRSPLLAQSDTPPYNQKLFGINLGGPIKKNRASFGLDVERRNVDENALILATTLDSSFNPVTVNETITTPQVRTSIVPRIDYSINSKNTLVGRYQHTSISLDNQGVGEYNLTSRAYNQGETENTAQLTETAVLSPRAINETRFQFMRTNTSMTNVNATTPTIMVEGAFTGGSSQQGGSGTVTNAWELSNSTTYTRGTHTVKWGGRLRQSFLDDTSMNNFAGSYTFFGSSGPELDANNQPIAGTLVQLTALEAYQRTLIFQAAGYTPAQIRALGGGATQFSLTAGVPTTAVNQIDVGVFANDDWKLKPNLTLSYGLRYETQSNIHDWSDVAPRVGIAWGLKGRDGQTKTVIRGGFGVFYDRISNSVTLQADRYNGTTQNSYLLLNPNFFPAIPTAEQLAEAQQPQSLQIMDQTLKAPRTYQISASVERQLNKYARISAMYIGTRGVHLQRSLNINVPTNGAYPYGTADPTFLTETVGLSRSNQLVISPNVSFKGMTVFGFYGLSHGMTDAEGQPANPYDLHAEWGPSTFADVRQRAVIGAMLPALWKVSISPFFMASSGTPYDITIGRDLNHDTIAAERPALLALSSGNCVGDNLLWQSGYGCFDMNPAIGSTTIGRNSARGPATYNLNMRVSRSWAFGRRGESGLDNGGPPPGMGGVRGGGPPPGGGPGGGGPPPGGGGPGGGGPPPGLFGSNSGKKYNLTLSASVRNILNHPNYAAPSGDLSSLYFGDYRSLAGFGPFGASTTYNRKIDFQLRFTF